MILEYDEPTGRISAQAPDIFLSLYPAGHKLKDGKDDYYRGALTISRGSERVHLNALDITDLLTFLGEDRVKAVRAIMTKEHTATNLLRMIFTESTLEDTDDITS